MIDEELYQQAADELNSDRRRAHIWARACALASDDHDEARYLYTNLRVEELIAERDAKGPATTQTLVEDHDSTLALEPLELEGEDPLGLADSAPLTLDAEEVIPESVSIPSGIDRPQDPDDVLQLLPEDSDSSSDVVSSQRAGFDDHLDQHMNFAADEHSSDDSLATDNNADLSAEHKTLEDDFLESFAEHQETIKAAANEQLTDDFIDDLDLNDPGSEFAAQQARADHDEQQIDFDGTTELDLDPDEIARINESSPGAVSAIHGGKLVDHDRPQDSIEHDQDAHDLSWLDDDLPPEHLPSRDFDRPLVNSEIEDDRLAQELERQADQLPGQRSDVIEHRESADATQESDIAMRDDSSMDRADFEARGHSDNAASPGFRDQVGVTPFTLPVDLTLDKRGTEFAVYKRDHKSQAVSTGVSWSALFFTLPFLIYRHLFGTAIVYSALALITLGGLLLSGLAWMDAGSSASTLIKVSTIGFALLGAIGLLYIPFRYANHWRGEKLEKRGYELVAWVRASTAGKAITEARRAAALD